MEADEFYVYPGGSYFTCGGCGWSLSPYQPERRPFKLRVCCYNRVCPKYLVVLLIGDEHRIAAFDTGERAVVDPYVGVPGGVVEVAIPGPIRVDNPMTYTNIHNIAPPEEPR